MTIGKLKIRGKDRTDIYALIGGMPIFHWAGYFIFFFLVTWTWVENQQTRETAYFKTAYVKIRLIFHAKTNLHAFLQYESFCTHELFKIQATFSHLFGQWNSNS